ncbi:MAG: hypothetical protein R3F54_29625 [Alphaproteobacteria bacterium]
MNRVGYLLPSMVTAIVVFRGLLWLDKSPSKSAGLGMTAGICIGLAVFWVLRRTPSSMAASRLQKALLAIGPFVVGGFLTGLLLAPFGETMLSQIASLFGGAIFALGSDTTPQLQRAGPKSS